MFQSGKASSEPILSIAYRKDEGKVYYDSSLNHGDGAGSEAFG